MAAVQRAGEEAGYGGYRAAGEHQAGAYSFIHDLQWAVSVTGVKRAVYSIDTKILWCKTAIKLAGELNNAFVWNVGNTVNLIPDTTKQCDACLANTKVVEFLSYKHTHTHTCFQVHITLRSSTQLRSPTKKAAWEFPQTEIELVLSQAEQEAVAGAWIIVQDKTLIAERTQRHHTSTDDRYKKKAFDCFPFLKNKKVP